MSVGVEHLIIQLAGENLVTFSSDAANGFRLDDRDVDFDLSQRINDAAAAGLLVVDRNADGSIVRPTGAGWAAIA